MDGSQDPTLQGISRRGFLKLGAASGLGIVAAPLLAACSSSGKSGSSTISFMAAEYSAKTAPFWKQTIADFEKANSGVKVNLQVVGWQQMHDTTAQRISAGTLPDVVNTASIWLPEWVQSKAIAPVTSAILPDSVSSRIVPTFIKNGGAYQGQTWGIPFAAAARAMFYNKTLFKHAGLDPNTPPATWSDLLAQTKQIKQRTGAYGYAFDGKGVQAFRYFGFFLWNNGGDFFTSDGKAAFNSPQGVQAMQFLVELANSGAVPNPTAEAIEDLEPLFTAGKIGMLIDGNYLSSTIASSGHGLSYGVAAVPVSSPSVTPVTWGVTDVLVVSKKANTSLVSKFIEYIYQPNVRTTFDSNEGNLPLLTSQQSAPQFQSAATQQFIKLLPTARFDPLNANYSKMQTLLTTAIQQAVTGAKSPQSALDAAASSFNLLAH